MKTLTTILCLMAALVCRAAVPPYSCDFSTTTGFKTIDANGDGKTFKFLSSYDYENDRNNYSARNESPAGGCDDWLVLPGMTLQAGKYYDFSADIKAWSDKWAETFELYVGTSASVAGMKTRLMDATTIKHNTYRRYTCGFMPDKNGTYYFAIRHINEVEGFYLYVDQVEVTLSATEQAPSAPTGLAIEPDYDGNLKADIHFTAPAVTLSGDPVSALTKAEVFRDGELIATIDSPEAGKAYTCHDEGMTLGYHEYAVCATSAAGTGPKASGTRWCGIPLPAPPASCHITETGIPGRVTMTWEAVTTDVDGYDINPALVRYVVIQVVNGEMVIRGWQVEGTSFTFDAMDDPSGQTIAYGGVYAFTNDYSKTAPGSNTLAIGTPYALPYEESYANGTPSHMFAAARTAGHGGAWDLATDSWATDVKSQDGDNGFATCKIDYKESATKLVLGKVDMPEGNAELRFWYFPYVTEDEESNTIDVWVTDDSYRLHEVATVEQAGQPGQWREAVVPLEGFGGQTVRIELNVTCVSRVYTIIDNVSIRTAVDGIGAPATGHAPTATPYDLTGRRITAPHRGLTIINGKKIVL